jgi:hypothetical protein
LRVLPRLRVTRLLLAVEDVHDRGETAEHRDQTGHDRSESDQSTDRQRARTDRGRCQRGSEREDRWHERHADDERHALHDRVDLLHHAEQAAERRVEAVRRRDRLLDDAADVPGFTADLREQLRDLLRRADERFERRSALALGAHDGLVDLEELVAQERDAREPLVDLDLDLRRDLLLAEGDELGLHRCQF